jgi:hypothetical protein
MTEKVSDASNTWCKIGDAASHAGWQHRMPARNRLQNCFYPWDAPQPFCNQKAQNDYQREHDANLSSGKMGRYENPTELEPE